MSARSKLFSNKILQNARNRIASSSLGKKIRKSRDTPASKMSDHDKIPGVHVKMYMRRDVDAGDYELVGEEVISFLNPQVTSIASSFRFLPDEPYGRSELDYVVVDGVEFTDFEKMMAETAVKTGSVVEVYSTAMNDDE